MEDSSNLLFKWEIIESRGIGRGKRYEITPKGLTIGRSPKADIIVLSSTVNEHHALIEWDSLREQYHVRDLSTVNGTFVNQQPLRGTTRPIERGDGLRFGYDTDQVFRVEVTKTTPTNNPPPVATSSTQTVEKEVSHSSADSSSILSHISIATSSNVSGCVPSPVHYVPVVNQPVQTIIVPSATMPATGQHAAVPQTGMMMATTVPMVTMIPMATSVPQIITSQTTVTTEGTSSSISSVVTSVTHTETRPVTSDERHTDLLRPRIDGRKSAPLIGLGSPLYGCPSWWGEDDEEQEEERREKKNNKEQRERNNQRTTRRGMMERDDEMPFSDSELIPRKPGSQILRDLDQRPASQTGPRSQPHLSDQASHSPEHNLPPQLAEEKPRPHSEERELTSFTVEMEAPRRKRPQKFMSKRPASYAGGLSNLETPQKPSSLKQDGSPTLQRRKPGRAAREKGVLGVAKKKVQKPPSGVFPKTRSSPAHIKESVAAAASRKNETFIVLEEELSTQQQEVAMSPKVLATPLQSQSEIIIPVKSHSQPGSLQGTPYAVSEPGSRPGSARKQWVDEEIPHSLIMASIETRMRRLAETAEQTVLNIRQAAESARKEGVALGGQVVLSVSASSDLPLWKIVNKEYQNISKYISQVEKSLRDINRVIVQQDEELEQVDCEQDEEEKDGQAHQIEGLLVDSIEEEKEEANINMGEAEEDCEGRDSVEEVEEEEEEVIRIERNLDYDGDDDSDQYYSASSDQEN